MQLRAIFGACAGLFFAAAASTQTVTTVVSNEPTSELYDMVIIGDGYRASEQALFNQNVADVVDYFQNWASLFPYGPYFQCYNVHTVFRASVESGTDQARLIAEESKSCQALERRGIVTPAASTAAVAASPPE